MKIKRVQELLEIVKNGYNNIAIDFDLTRKKALWPVIYEFTSLVKDGDRLLDLACGNGRLLEALEGKKINYLGVDNSEELLNLARRNYPNRKFILSDMLELKHLGDKKFNHIFCLAALQHVPSRALRIDVLKKIRSKLDDGGSLVLSNWNLFTKPVYKHKLIKRYFLRYFKKYQEEWNDLIFPWKDSSGREKGLRYYHVFTKKELIKLAQDSDFKIVSLKKDKYNLWLHVIK
jgi:2-polyprenyl-3-methyl-5-hydroxy-6-metoxy-1,4-benzoquinol methylase